MILIPRFPGHSEVDIRISSSEWLLCRDELQVMLWLKGRYKRITGLAYSDSLSVLVSSGADGQVHYPWSRT